MRISSRTVASTSAGFVIIDRAGRQLTVLDQATTMATLAAGGERAGTHFVSRVVRDFATVRQGLDARVLTLSELRRLTGTRRLAALIETYYRPAFAQDGPAGASPERAVTGARRVISQW